MDKGKRGGERKYNFEYGWEKIKRGTWQMEVYETVLFFFWSVCF